MITKYKKSPVEVGTGDFSCEIVSTIPYYQVVNVPYYVANRIREYYNQTRGNSLSTENAYKTCVKHGEGSLKHRDSSWVSKRIKGVRHYLECGIYLSSFVSRK
jgi:hypothetical protein